MTEPSKPPRDAGRPPLGAPDPDERGADAADGRAAPVARSAGAPAARPMPPESRPSGSDRAWSEPRASKARPSGSATPDAASVAPGGPREPSRWTHARRQRLTGVGSWAVTVVLAAVSLWALADSLHWSATLLADHRWQLGWLCLFGAGCASAVRAWGASGTLFFLALVHLRVEMALSLPTQEMFAAGERVRVATVSSGWGPEPQEALAGWLDEERPDLALVQRLVPEGLAALDGRTDGSVVAAWPPRADWTPETVGRALWAREGIETLAVVPDGGLVDATVRIDGRPLHVLGLRPPHVLDAGTAERRDALFRETARRAAADPAVVVLGDLGVTSYNRAFRTLLAGGGLRDSRRGFGRQATWSSDWTPFGFVLAVDHVLTGEALRCVARRHHWDVQSDHQPVLAELVWTEAGAGE